MNEAMVQAVLRFVRVMVVAAIGAGVANVTILSSLVGDPVYATMITSIVLAALEFLAKLVGGPTTPAPEPIKTLGAMSAPRAERPNILSI